MPIVDCDSYFSIVFIRPVPGVQLVNTGAKKSTTKGEGLGRGKGNALPKPPSFSLSFLGAAVYKLNA